MDPQKYTQDWLPVVSKETYESLLGILQRESRRTTFDSDVEKRIRHENPRLLQILDQVLHAYGAGEFADGIAFGMMFTYDLLRRQMAAYNMEQGKRS